MAVVHIPAHAHNGLYGQTGVLHQSLRLPHPLLFLKSENRRPVKLLKPVFELKLIYPKRMGKFHQRRQRLLCLFYNLVMDGLQHLTVLGPQYYIRRSVSHARHPLARGNPILHMHAPHGLLCYANHKIWPPFLLGKKSIDHTSTRMFLPPLV